ncbi:SpoIIE family protein phosphatase [Lentzea sp.]|uniref:SpoIIE family protein phosphatase n=1 Tax=Lentzea sp. TaxID=56099 RepID=UPI002CDFF008|nr:SpoIIE family protein phosphatase [Lentzea sp.]HUQ55048.1 SpoIIE family protein phosphatase [Lentzea sp.]
MRSHGADDERAAAVVLSQVVEQMPSRVVAFEGPGLRTVAATGACREWAGCVGETAREAFAEVGGRPAAEAVERVYATGGAECLRDLRTEPGLDVRAEHFCDWTITPRRGGDGEVVGVTVDVADVTERMADRRRAADAERRQAEATDAVRRESHPRSVPLLPGAQVAASCLPAAGGDWFDALVLPDGRLGLVVGDVVGHGPAAGQLSVVLSERLAATGDAVAAIRSADAAAHRIPGAGSATVCVAVLDPGTGLVEHASAGPPPPLVVTAGGARFLRGPGVPPLAVGGERDPRVGRAALAPGDLVLLHTGGVLDRPGRTLAECADELARAAEDVAADRAFRGELPLAADRLCTARCRASRRTRPSR